MVETRLIGSRLPYDGRRQSERPVHRPGIVIQDNAEQVAEERFDAGYDLSEVQTGFNVLEEAIWARALAVVDPARLAETLGLVTTVLGAGKDALARRYVSLAAGAHAPSLDLRALFAGAAAGDPDG